MTKMPHTHYDNLKVQAGASEQEIRGAYRRLVSKHHPDRHGNSPESVRIMQIINQSYDVLCDPARRAQHDHWILAQQSGPSSNNSGSVRWPEGSGWADDEPEPHFKKERPWSSLEESVREYLKLHGEILASRSAYFKEIKSLSFCRRCARQITWILFPSRQPLSVKAMENHYKMHGVLPDVSREPCVWAENFLIFVSVMFLVAILID